MFHIKVKKYLDNDTFLFAYVTTGRRQKYDIYSLAITNSILMSSKPFKQINMIVNITVVFNI